MSIESAHGHQWTFYNPTQSVTRRPWWWRLVARFGAHT